MCSIKVTNHNVAHLLQWCTAVASCLTAGLPLVLHAWGPGPAAAVAAGRASIPVTCQYVGTVPQLPAAGYLCVRCDMSPHLLLPRFGLACTVVGALYHFDELLFCRHLWFYKFASSGDTWGPPIVPMRSAFFMHTPSIGRTVHCSVCGVQCAAHTDHLHVSGGGLRGSAKGWCQPSHPEACR